MNFNVFVILTKQMSTLDIFNSKLDVLLLLKFNFGNFDLLFSNKNTVLIAFRRALVTFGVWFKILILTT